MEDCDWVTFPLQNLHGLPASCPFKSKLSAWLHCTCQVSHTVMKRAPSALDTSVADVGGEAQLFLFYSCLFVFLT